MDTRGLVLVIPEKGDAERDAVADAWESAGGEVLRVGRFWDPPPIDPATVRLYGNDSFCLVLAQKLGLALISPADDAILSFPAALLGRTIVLRRLGDALDGPFPIFTKPETPKVFRAGVYASREALEAECAGLAPVTPVLVSEIVELAAEARAFVLDGSVLDCALYEGAGHREAARAAAEAVVAAISGVSLPPTYVLDLGLVPGGWVVVELNASWGAGLNRCDAARVVPAIARATTLDPGQLAGS